ncbi:MAG TPA: hypothetical protein VLB84_15180 [Bacteroidia bacterium]|nr:hypothetical protein [Bacteroidia bacterium]
MDRPRLGMGEGGDQTSPLGVAVIGGLLFSTIATLIFLPLTFYRMTKNKPIKNNSLDPNDSNSLYYDIHQ